MEDIREIIYDGSDLGSVCGEEDTSFKLFSPTADQVTLNLYSEGAGGESLRHLPMTKGLKGVWEVTVKERLDGIYYDYTLFFGGTRVLCADPYAKACGVNGRRSMAVDLSLTDPEGWSEDQAPEKEAEDIIWELHVKEFSHDPRGGFSPELRGKYLAFTQTHTTLDGDGKRPTGLPYLKELGVSYLQLMPVYDYGSVDEAGEEHEFNWGYDPLNYNVPEGSYSTDPFHGQVRIREMKEMIKAIHSHGFRVIMDVVYNHTFSTDSWLERSVPGYFYRTNEDGSKSNGSGCGNDVASERPMCAKYILDSVLYWTREYHIDGFRFDLMGLLDTDLMNRIRRELDLRYGTGEKLIYGEPWAAGPSPMENGRIPALRNNVSHLDRNVGLFCDNTRDAIRGHVFEAKKPGFVNGGKGFEENILNSVTAWCTPGVPHPVKAPSQLITYSSAHDNHTLWDKLVLTMKEIPDFDGKDPAVLKANKLAAVITFTCQGRLFLLSGEEFGRTKQGEENSYQDSVLLNRLDWGRAYEFTELREYYRDLLALRKQIPGLCDKSEEADCRIRDKRILSEGLVSFVVDHGEMKTSCPWNRLFVAYHAGTEETMLPLPEGNWEILADHKSAGHWREQGQKERQLAPGEMAIAGVCGVILGERRG